MARAGVIVEVVEPCELVATGGAAIAKVRRPIAVVGRQQPRGGRFVAKRRHQVTVAG